LIYVHNNPTTPSTPPTTNPPITHSTPCLTPTEAPLSPALVPPGISPEPLLPIGGPDEEDEAAEEVGDAVAMVEERKGEAKEELAAKVEDVEGEEVMDAVCLA
jgi:hypothetical protein